MGVRDAAVLDAGDCVIERLRDGADAAAAHVVSFNGDAHRRKPVWIVASDGRGNDIEGGVGDAVHAELRVGANDEGAQVKRRARQLAGEGCEIRCGGSGLRRRAREALIKLQEWSARDFVPN